MPKKRGRPPKSRITVVGIAPSISANQREAIALEYAGVKDWAHEPWPSQTPAQKIASKLGVSRQMVHRWRRDPLYLQALQQEGAKDIAVQMGLGSSNKALAPPTLRQQAALLHSHVAKNWSGSVVSIIDGKTYQTVEDYVAHLIAENVVPAPKFRRINRKG